MTSQHDYDLPSALPLPRGPRLLRGWFTFTLAALIVVVGIVLSLIRWLPESPPRTITMADQVSSPEDFDLLIECYECRIQVKFDDSHAFTMHVTPQFEFLVGAEAPFFDEEQYWIDKKDKIPRGSIMNFASWDTDLQFRGFYFFNADELAVEPSLGARLAQRQQSKTVVEADWLITLYLPSTASPRKLALGLTGLVGQVVGVNCPKSVHESQSSEIIAYFTTYSSSLFSWESFPGEDVTFWRTALVLVDHSVKSPMRLGLTDSEYCGVSPHTHTVPFDKLFVQGDKVDVAIEITSDSDDTVADVRITGEQTEVNKVCVGSDWTEPPHVSFFNASVANTTTNSTVNQGFFVMEAVLSNCGRHCSSPRTQAVEIHYSTGSFFMDGYSDVVDDESIGNLDGKVPPAPGYLNNTVTSTHYRVWKPTHYRPGFWSSDLALPMGIVDALVTHPPDQDQILSMQLFTPGRHYEYSLTSSSPLLRMPYKQTWLWTNRRLALQLQPAFLVPLSGNLLTPLIFEAAVGLSPGYCGYRPGRLPPLIPKPNTWTPSEYDMQVFETLAEACSHN